MDRPIHHVVARAKDGARLFVDAADRVAYLEALGTIVGDHGWHCLAYCLMRNHVHLLVQAERVELRSGARRLRKAHGRRLGLRHGVPDDVWQTGARGARIRTDEQLWAAAAYIAANPVDAGLCLDPARYPWSSHAATTGAVAAPSWLADEQLLELLCGSADAAARRRYAVYVAERGRRRVRWGGGG